MKKHLLIVSLTLALSAVEAWSQAGAANMIKGRARETAGRPAPPKNGAPGGGGAAPARRSPATPATTRTLSPARAIESDLSLIRIKPSVTDELRDRLAGHIAEAASGDVKPDPKAVSQLAFEVATAMQKHKLGYGERKKLGEVLILSVNRDPAAAAGVLELGEILSSAGVTNDEWKPLAASLQGLSATPVAASQP